MCCLNTSDRCPCESDIHYGEEDVSSFYHSQPGLDLCQDILKETKRDPGVS